MSSRGTETVVSSPPTQQSRIQRLGTAGDDCRLRFTGVGGDNSGSEDRFFDEQVEAVVVRRPGLGGSRFGCPDMKDRIPAGECGSPNVDAGLEGG